jgi:hypothetical protein
VLGLMFEPVPRHAQPPLLTNMGFRPYELFDEFESGPPRLTRPANLNADPGTSAMLEFARLVAEASKRITEAQTILTRQQTSSGVTVYVGSAPSAPLDQRCAAVLRRELLIRGHRVTTDEPVPAESEDSYRLRLETVMGNAQLSVHLLNETAPAMAGWKRSPIAWQIRKAAQAGSVSVMSWVDQDASYTDAGALAELEGATSEGSHRFEKQNFETFKAAVLRRADELARAAVPEVRTSQAGQAEESDKLVVVAFDERDIDRAARIADYMRKRGLQTQLALPPGKGAAERKRQNIKYYKQADGVLVYFGESDDLWVQNTCDAVRDSMRPDGQRALVVGPPPDQPRLKRSLQEREFECYRATNDDDVTSIDAWLKQLDGPSARSAALGS